MASSMNTSGAPQQPPPQPVQINQSRMAAGAPAQPVQTGQYIHPGQYGLQGAEPVVYPQQPVVYPQQPVVYPQQPQQPVVYPQQPQQPVHVRIPTGDANQAEKHAEAAGGKVGYFFLGLVLSFILGIFTFLLFICADSVGLTRARRAPFLIGSIIGFVLQIVATVVVIVVLNNSYHYF